MCVYRKLNEARAKKPSKKKKTDGGKYIIRKDGKYAKTEDNKKVPKICPKCGAEMTLRIMGEPVYICKNDHYFGTMKFNESYDFGSIKKERHNINIYKGLKTIKEMISNRKELNQKQYDLLISFPGVYKLTYENTKKELIEIAQYFIEQFGNFCSLNWIDVSDVTDMSSLFAYSDFNGDISQWDTHNVVTFRDMFYASKFDGDISRWDVSNVTNMQSMFSNSFFNGDISKWDVSSVTDMRWMFNSSKFNGDISKWDVSSVTTMFQMFFNSDFNGNLNKWKINSNANTEQMFMFSPLSSNTPEWYNANKGFVNIDKISESFDFNMINKDKTGRNVNIYKIFLQKFLMPAEDLSSKELLEMREITFPDNFYKAKSRGELDNLIRTSMKVWGNQCDLNWIDVSDITDMSGLFYNISFKGDISRWNVSNVTTMSNMFCITYFNGDISDWDVSGVVTMNGMFQSSEFTGDISGWDVSHVTDMSWMFAYSLFDGDISRWDVSNCMNMKKMFSHAQFNRDLNVWKVSKSCNTKNMFFDSGIYYNGKLPRWFKGSFKVQESFDFDGVDKQRKHLSAYDMIFQDKLDRIIQKIINKDNDTALEQDEKEFMCSLKPGTYKANDDEFRQLVRNYVVLIGYGCDLNWIDTCNITNMRYLFDGMTHFNGDISKWDVSNVTDMQEVFSSTDFNGDISGWDVSNVKYMEGMFEYSPFNGDISGWDVSNVTDMSFMFMETPFNGDISKWDVSNVEDMSNMFFNAKFNGDISKWDVSKVDDIRRMFYKSEFSGDISGWNIKDSCRMYKTFTKSKLQDNPPKWYKKENLYKNILEDTVINEAFDFSSVKNTRNSDVAKSIENLQHEQDFIDVPNMTKAEHAKLNGFVSGIQKTDQDIHYTYIQDRDNAKNRILKIFTNDRVLHMFVKKYLALKEFLESNGLSLTVIPVCDRLNVWYTGQTCTAIAPVEYQFDMDTNASVLKGWKCDNVILDGFVVSGWDTYDNEGGRSFRQFYQLVHNSNRIYMYNCSYSPNSEKQSKHMAHAVNHKMMILKHSAQHLKNAVNNINNNRSVDLFSCNSIHESFNFEYVNKDRKQINIVGKLLNNIKDTIDNRAPLTEQFYDFLIKETSFYKVSDIEDLINLIQYFTNQFGNNVSLNWIDVSDITDMHGIFYNSKFNGDISRWDVGKVKDMSRMFNHSDFNGDISRWDVGNVINMKAMFSGSHFIGDISKWNVGNVLDMTNMFIYTSFNSDISKWDVSNVCNMRGMFYGSEFNGDISKWNVGNVRDMSQMFEYSEFNGDISDWDVSNVATMGKMFFHSKFSGDLNKWNIDNVKNLKEIFQRSPLEKNPPKWFKTAMYESFDFDLVDNSKKQMNIYDELYKIKDLLDYNEPITKAQYDILTTYTGFYMVEDSSHLKDLINTFTDNFGYNCNLNWIDVSNITDMSSMFEESDFNGDISEWDTGNVQQMQWMFRESSFNGDISKWNVRNVLDMSNMFSCSEFNGNISNWDVSNVADMSNMFYMSKFNGDISKWDVSSVTNMAYMFNNSVFNGDISKWNTVNVRDMSHMFGDSQFDGDISKWDVSHVTNMSYMFRSSKFNGDVSNWDVSSVTNIQCIFCESKFNQNISEWDVSNVRYMQAMFMDSKFNGDISKWDVGNVTNMYAMFSDSEFTGDISKWNVSNVTNMVSMFRTSSFNGDISKWDVSGVTNMSFMFFKSKFNGDISKWDVSNVTNMQGMFTSSIFNGDISKWDVSNVLNMEDMFFDSKFNGDISGWKLNRGVKMYTMFLDSAIGEHPEKQCKKHSKKHRASVDESFDFTEVGMNKKNANIYNELYVIKDALDAEEDINEYQYKLLTTQVGFYKPENRRKFMNLVKNIIDSFGPDCNLNWIDTSGINDMTYLFYESDFNGDVSKWDVHNVVYMRGMFARSKFNGDISEWDVSIVKDMGNMFFNSPFNGDISRWNTCSLEDMESMFESTPFNGDISGWDVSKVTNMESAFSYSEFTGDISSWKPANNVRMYKMFYHSSFPEEELPEWYMRRYSDKN